MLAHMITWYNVKEHIYNIEKRYSTDLLVIYVDKMDSKKEEFKRSYKEIESYCKEFNKDLSLKKLDSNDLINNTVIMGRDILELSNRGYDFIINLSGGRRALSIALFYAVILLRLTKLKQHVKVVIKPESREPIQFIIPRFLVLDEDDIRILKYIKDGLNVTNIGAKIGKSQSTTSFRIKKLEDAGYIKTFRRERKLTELGELIVNIH